MSGGPAMRKLLVLLLFGQLAAAVPVTFRVFYASGVPAKDVLVIIQDLENHPREVFRVLSDEYGNAGRRELGSGLYRMIATAPYGIWQTTIKEFILGSPPLEMALGVEFMPTHGYGDIVVTGTTWTELQLLQADGQPLSNAQLLVRDRTATLYTERWYKTDVQGRVKVEMMSDPMILIILHHDSIMTTELPERNSPKAIKFIPD